MGASGSRGDGEGEGGEEPTVLQLASGMRVMLSEGNVILMNPAGRHSRPEPWETRDPDEEPEREDVLELPHLQFLTRLFGPRRSNFRHSSLFEEDVEIQPTPLDPQCDLYQQIKYDTGQLTGSSQNVLRQISRNELMSDTPTAGQKISTTMNMLPRYSCIADQFEARVFCGSYSKDGSKFISACQDKGIYLYDTSGGQFCRRKRVQARDVGWSVLDVTLSPDQEWFAYSTWSPYVYLCNVEGTQENHYSLDLSPNFDDRFGIFALRFSSDNKEIVASANDGFIYLYDREHCGRVLRIDAHQDDANAVAFADESSQVICSGGDDGLCKVWDRRTLSESNPTPVGVFAGHKDGITYIDPKGDNRYLITNSKDQSIKLWDLRRFSPGEGESATLARVGEQFWDYRDQDVPKRVWKDMKEKLPGDSSVNTYAGHLVKHTLLRCHFSPMATTGQRYIYTACARGRVIIYDVLTGRIVDKLMSRQCQRCIRDVCWHPFEPGVLVSSSWDGYLQMWTREQRRDYVKLDSLEPRRLINY